MGKEILMLGDIETEKNKFFSHKSPILLKDVDIEKVLVSKNVSSGEKTLSTLLVTCMMIVKLNHYI